MDKYEQGVGDYGDCRVCGRALNRKEKGCCQDCEEEKPDHDREDNRVNNSAYIDNIYGWGEGY